MNGECVTSNSYQNPSKQVAYLLGGSTIKEKVVPVITPNKIINNKIPALLRKAVNSH